MPRSSCCRADPACPGDGVKRMMASAQAAGDSTAAPPQSPGRAERWSSRPCSTALQPGWMGPDEAETFTCFSCW